MLQDRLRHQRLGRSFYFQRPANILSKGKLRAKTTFGGDLRGAFSVDFFIYVGCL